MKGLFTLIALSFIFTLNARAQTEPYPPHAQTAAPVTARFEIIQSHLAAKWTFLLDKTKGKVYQLVQTKNDGLAWQEILVRDLPKTRLDGKVRYQLFTSGIAARHTFLINLENSKTWLLVANTDEKGQELLAWEPFEDN